MQGYRQQMDEYNSNHTFRFEYVGHNYGVLDDKITSATSVSFVKCLQ
jgi:hypothetical protein